MGAKQDFLKRVERMLDPALARIDDEAIAAVAIGELPDIGQSEPAPAAVAGSARDVILFALALNAINHQFWDVVDGKFERYKNGGMVGAVAMRAGLAAMVESRGSMEAWSRGPNPTLTDVERFFGPIPDPAGRARALAEAFGPKGQAAADMLQDAAAGGETWGVPYAQALATLLPLGYRDDMLKKAQLCMWMSKGMLEAGGHSAPEVDLTCFADYQVPKVLRGLGVLRYASALEAKVDSGCILEEGGAHESAIRAATVVACERLAVAKGLSAPQLDYWLWTKRNDFAQPFHLTRTMKY